MPVSIVAPCRLGVSQAKSGYTSPALNEKRELDL